jgi:hypothetical protein
VLEKQPKVFCVAKFDYIFYGPSPLLATSKNARKNPGMSYMNHEKSFGGIISPQLRKMTEDC